MVRRIVIRVLLRKGITVLPTLICMGMILSFETSTSDTQALSEFDKKPLNQYLSRFTEFRSISTAMSDEAPASVPQTQHWTAEVSERLNCEELKALLEEAQLNPEQKFRLENKFGNRGVYFSEFQNRSVKIVIKVATLTNASLSNQRYRYHSAIREIRNLKTLNGLNFTGAPTLYGFCIEPAQITYAVTRFTESQEVCSGRGYDVRCAMAQDVVSELQNSKNSAKEAIRFLEKVTCFFSQFEKYNMLMEDISGTNFHLSTKTWNLYLVDADSIIFYEDSPLYSRMACHTNRDCPKPSGSLWPTYSLNRRIYTSCGEVYGNCANNTCRGLESSLHTCGIGHWLIKPLRKFIPAELYKFYKEIADCTTRIEQSLRCTMTSACSKASSILKAHSNAIIPQK